MNRTQDCDDASLARALNDVAEAIGVPVETFFDPRNAESGVETIQLIRAWSSIRDRQARRRVLNAALRAVEPDAPAP